MLDEKNKFELIEETSEVEELEDLSNVALEDLPKDSFELVDNKDYAFDRKFETKPTTFLKDSIKRFSKNKSSVVATWILGILLAMAFLVPIIDTNDVSVPHPEQVYLEPKLFDSGTGFWDGCKSFSNIAYDVDEERPDPTDFPSLSAISKLKVDSAPTYTNSYSRLGKGGYVNLGKYIETETDIIYLKSYRYDSAIDLSYSLDFNIQLHDEEIELYQRVPFSIDFIYHDQIDSTTSIEHVANMVNHSTDYDAHIYCNVIAAILAENPTPVSVRDGYFKISIDTADAELNPSILIKSLEITTNSSDSDYSAMVGAPTFLDANEMVGRTKTVGTGVNQADNKKYWTCNGNKFIYKAEVTYCSFIYDTYEGAFGIRTWDIQGSELKKYKDNGWCTYSIGHDYQDVIDSFTIKNESKCPIIKVYAVTKYDGAIPTYSFTCEVYFYRVLGMNSMPRYIMGTDQAGRDMFKYVFDGLKTSLLLGIITSAICFTFGLCWGAISGYFGGAVDLAMERFTDILGGLPWIVVMTLCIVHLGQNFGTFALALCLTGWIGTASGTRTQFYRFKGREYVLASRTLGAKDMRLIFKHILPNAMGTIITSAVLMIPSVIFSEATISYLGLGLRGMSSLGVILSKNQGELLQHPYLLLFPSVVIALLMISFNLFGNGLRDAINPSLKGEGE